VSKSRSSDLIIQQYVRASYWSVAAYLPNPGPMVANFSWQMEHSKEKVRRWLFTNFCRGAWCEQKQII
jgi:hypothetical protein